MFCGSQDPVLLQPPGNITKLFLYELKLCLQPLVVLRSGFRFRLFSTNERFGFLHPVLKSSDLRVELLCLPEYRFQPCLLSLRRL